MRLARLDIERQLGLAQEAADDCAKLPADLNWQDYTQMFGAGQWAILHGDIEHALQWYTRAMELRPDIDAGWSHTADVLAYLGKTEEYQALCRRMWEKFAATSMVDEAAKHSMLMPDPEHQIQIAGQYQKLRTPRKAELDVGKAILAGAAEYRTGNFQAAIDRMSVTLRISNCLSERVTAHAFIAMAHHQLGHRIEAEESLLRTSALPRLGEDPRGETPGRLLTALVVVREAEAMIHGK